MASQRDNHVTERPTPTTPHPKRGENILLHWLKRNTFEPDFLRPPFHSPITGYLIAILLLLAVVITRLWLGAFFPSLHFVEVFLILVVVLISLTWGAAPSMLATLVGTVLLDYFIAPPLFSLLIKNIDDVLGISLYTIAGLTISLLASQAQRARNEAERASTGRRAGARTGSDL